MLTIAQTLARAAEVAKRLDHCKGKLVKYDGFGGKLSACCVLGAMTVARDEAYENEQEPSPHTVYDYVEKAMPELLDKGFLPSATIWNDLRSTTKQDVVDLLEALAKQAEAEGV